MLLEMSPRGPVPPLPQPEKRQEMPQEQRHEPRRQPVRRWPLFVIASPAAVAIWSGWVALGALCGFGLVQPFPGILPWHLDTAITLPVGVEAYGAYALGAWLSPGTPRRARAWARMSAAGSLALGAAGQVIYHLLAAAHATRAPWPVVVIVSCIPVVTLGCAAALTHLLRAGDDDSDSGPVAADGSDTGGGSGSDTEPAIAPVRDDRPEAPQPLRRPRPPRDKVADTIRRHQDWDNDKIAAHCGVSKRTVERRRGAVKAGVKVP